MTSPLSRALSFRKSLVLPLALLGVLAIPLSAEAQPRQWSPRLRFGLSGVGGGFVGSVHGGLGGISPRVGIQFSDVFAVMIQGQGLVGRFVPYPNEDLAGFAFHAAMFELTAGDMFQIAAGPSLDFVWGCSTDRGQPACARGGAYLGGDLRLALVFGGRHDVGPRTGFAISVDVHPTLLDDNQWSNVILLGFGFELY